MIENTQNIKVYARKKLHRSKQFFSVRLFLSRDLLGTSLNPRGNSIVHFTILQFFKFKTFSFKIAFKELLQK